jgi:hypothetical protein
LFAFIVAKTLADRGFRSIVAKMIKANPKQADEINAFVKWLKESGGAQWRSSVTRESE